MFPASKAPTDLRELHAMMFETTSDVTKNAAIVTKRQGKSGHGRRR